MIGPQQKIDLVQRGTEVDLFRAVLDASPHGLMLRSGESILYRNAAWELLEKATSDDSGSRTIHRLQYGFEHSGRPIEVSIAQDVTERRRMEAQLREAQRLESLGRWVGGVVHDFNNLLTAVMLYSDLLAEQLTPESLAAGYNEEVREAVKRGTDLISQLLSFARQQHSEPEVFSLNSQLRSLREVLRRMSGEDIDLVYELVDTPCNIRITPSQMEQVIFNLALNARDATPTGGKICIRTEERPGETNQVSGYVAMIVSDNGCGMDRETLARVFEPFFSTKPQGKGTGLGLTTVQSIVTQCGGTMTVESSLGQGTSVTVLFPTAAVMPKIDAVSPIGSDVPHGFETVLVVEDDPAVRESVREALSQCGYDVKVAAGGPEAVAVADGLKNSLDLLVADLVLPGMSGRGVARKLRSVNPSLRVLFISGYDQSEEVQDSDEIVFLKPFSREALARKVRLVLDCEKPGSVRHGG